MPNKKAIVVHSGGVDSSICLAIAIRDFSKEEVLSLSFNYGQRHLKEIEYAEAICQEWGVDHRVVYLPFLKELTTNSLMDEKGSTSEKSAKGPATLVMGRNGLMARIAAIHAHQLGANFIYMGIMEGPDGNSGYRDCSREYMDLKQEILRIDLANPLFEIRTPLVKISKKESLQIASEMGILSYLLENTVTCYHGIPCEGCGNCLACGLRQKSIQEYFSQIDSTTNSVDNRSRS